MRDHTTIQIERDGGRVYLCGKGEEGGFTLPLSTSEAQTLGATLTAASSKETETQDAEFTTKKPLEIHKKP